jgi:phage baseplate assembly protein W
MATTTTHNRYGAPMSLATARVAASKVKQRYGCSYPLVTQLKGNITGSIIQQNTKQLPYFNKESGIALYRNNLRQLLLTEKGERIMLPDYGLSLSRYLFEPLDEITYNLIKSDILKTLAKYYSIAHVISLAVSATDEEAERNQLRVALTLQIMDGSLEIYDIEVKLG